MSRLQPMRTALPVPALGHALGQSGENYIASLDISIGGGDDDGSILTTGDGSILTTGDVFEMLMLAIGLRSLAFAPRSLAFTPNGIDAIKLSNRIDANWSSIDSSARDMPEVLEIANDIQEAARHWTRVSWTQFN